MSELAGQFRQDERTGGKNMKLVKAYKYLFYRTYIWQLDRFGDDKSPKFTAILVNSTCLYFNLLTLFVGFEIVTGAVTRLGNLHLILMLAGLAAVSYFLLVHGNKSESIVAELAAESEGQRKRRTVWCWVYVIATLLVFIFSFLVLSPGSRSPA